MSSPDSARRRTLGVVAAAGFALALGGCLRPLYGPTASGERMQDLLASIEVAEPTTAVLQERLGHYVRSELIFLLDGSGQPKAKRYRLTLNLTEGVQSPIVDTITGRTESATVVGRATYTLYAPDGASSRRARPRARPPSTARPSASPRCAPPAKPTSGSPRSWPSRSRPASPQSCSAPPEAAPAVVAVKTGDVAGTLRRIPPGIAVVLVYGPDAGLVGERARAAAEATVSDPNDPFQLVRIEGDARCGRSRPARR
jgi:hypothetical protein